MRARHVLVRGNAERNGNLDEKPRQATILDIAEAAGVSPMTVSRVLNGRGGAGVQTRERVMALAQSLHYRPNAFAKSLKNDRSQVIGIVVPDIANPFFPEIIRGAELVARPAGYTLLSSNIVEDPDREAEVLETLLRHRVDGVILCSARLDEARLLQAIGTQRAVVLINRAVSSRFAGCVEIDYRLGAELAVDHLVASGCRRIAYASGPATSFGGLRRQEGLDLALRSREMALVEQCMFQPDLAGGYAAALWLTPQLHRLDAVFCYNDLMAMGISAGLQAQGVRIPEDLSLIGCDDIAAAGLVTPSLTTLRVAKQALGELAMRMLLDRIEGRNAQQRIVLEPELIVRGSTRPRAW